jgi:hypothetical protein
LQLQELLAKWAAALRARCWTRERAGFARLLNRSVRASIVPRKTWEALFRSQGMKNPTPRIRMLDGFNEGWLAFEHDTRKGRVELDLQFRERPELAPIIDKYLADPLTNPPAGAAAASQAAPNGPSPTRLRSLSQPSVEYA